jgi:hypothetical protein
MDNLGAIELDLPHEVNERPEAAAPFDPGFSTTFIHEITPWVFGAADPSLVTRANSEDQDGNPG